MKKLLLSFLFLPLFVSAQTVPNGNFESWLWVGMIEYFEFWNSESTEEYNVVSVDLNAYEGDAAMRITARPIGVGDYGKAYNLFEIDGIPAALNFYAKTDVENGGVSVEITFLNQDVEVYSEEWFSSATLTNYTLVSIPLNQITPSIITHARIKVMAQVGDLVAGTAWISVDDMEFGEPLSIERKDESSFQIYPNPAVENLTIETTENLESVDIFNITGVKIKSLTSSEINKTIDVSTLTTGIYLLRLNTAAGSFVKRIVIE